MSTPYSSLESVLETSDPLQTLVNDREVSDKPITKVLISHGILESLGYNPTTICVGHNNWMQMVRSGNDQLTVHINGKMSVDTLAGRLESINATPVEVAYTTKSSLIATALVECKGDVKILGKLLGKYSIRLITAES